MTVYYFCSFSPIIAYTFAPVVQNSKKKLRLFNKEIFDSLSLMRLFSTKNISKCIVPSERKKKKFFLIMREQHRDMYVICYRFRWSKLRRSSMVNDTRKRSFLCWNNTWPSDKHEGKKEREIERIERKRSPVVNDRSVICEDFLVASSSYSCS